MKLEKKKFLASKALKVGTNRIIFNNQRLAEIKEAITKQDMRDLFADKAILIKPVSGRLKKISRKTRRKAGSRRKSVKSTKKEYIIITRKLRRHLYELRRKEKISEEDFKEARKKIRNRAFKSKAQLKEHLEGA